MRTFTDMSIQLSAPSVCALGCFDGVHIGHASIIEEAVRLAKELSVSAAVWSFTEPPKNFFLKDKIKLLTTRSEKRELMQKLGVDVLVSIPFSAEIASMSAKEFFEDVLLKKLNVVHLICGFNYRFGKGGEGNTEMLTDMCKKHGVGLSIIPQVSAKKLSVSSSEIRIALSEGNTAAATAMLGRPYSITATVVHGQHLGRSLGFPTINQLISKKKLAPRNGVYVSRTRIGRLVYYGITNIGMRPTVDGKVLCAETNIFDYKGDLYGKRLTVELLNFMRPEQKFNSLDELTTQVHLDIQEAKNYVNDL